MTDDYSCRTCGAAMFVPDGEDPLEAEVRFCGSCAIDEIKRLREENTALREAVQSAHERADYWTEQAAGYVAERDRLQEENNELREDWNAMANREKDHVTTAENLKCEVNRLRAEIAIAEKARQACES
jgi:uncharacterized coiled-coil DUF342 family protein